MVSYSEKGGTLMEDDRIWISSILDAVYCKRRWYLCCVEGFDAMNYKIEQGSQAHEEVDKNRTDIGVDCVTCTNLRVYSEKLGLVGFCDEVRFEYCENGAVVPYTDYPVRIVVVERKLSKSVSEIERIAQLTAYVMCLEEMYGCDIEYGYLYYVTDDECKKVDVSQSHRQMVLDAVDFMRNFDGGDIKPEYSYRKCKNCAMLDICRPRETDISEYMNRLWGDCYADW